jgi:hypothetical protein
MFFNSVYIVQFLGPKDTEKTGHDLQEFLDPHAKQAGVNLGFIDVSTAEDAVAALWTIVDDCRRRGAGPVLHLETHADTIGIRGPDDQRVEWRTLIEPLTELNRLSKMNLLVTVAACSGLNLVRALLPGQPFPVWAVFGPDTQVLPSDVLAGFKAFYLTLLTKLDLNAAIAALKAADRSWPDAWKFQNAELFLAYMFGVYLDNEAKPGARNDHVEKLVAELRANGITDSAALESFVRASVDDEAGAFTHIKKRSLMLDEFPENADRFPMDINEVHRVRRLSRELREAADRPVG